MVTSDQPLILDCVAHYTDDAGTHVASIQWLKDSQPVVLSPPNKYGLLLLVLLGYVLFIVLHNPGAERMDLICFQIRRCTR